MKTCKKCGASVNDGVRFCPSCGSSMEEVVVSKPVVSSGDTFNADEVANLKTDALIGLLFPFVPMITKKNLDSEYVKLNINQGCILWIMSIGVSIISFILGFIKTPRYVYGIYYGTYTAWWVGLISFILSIPVTVLGIMAIINCINGKNKKLPIVGDLITFIK